MFEVFYRLNSSEYVVPCLFDAEPSQEYFNMEARQVCRRREEEGEGEGEG
jgi:hypothetical protein